MKPTEPPTALTAAIDKLPELLTNCAYLTGPASTPIEPPTKPIAVTVPVFLKLTVWPLSTPSILPTSTPIEPPA